MTKRVRWDGPGPVAIFDSEAPVYNPPLVANVNPGELLPLKTDQGDPMPTRIHDEFAHKENTDWTEVNQADPKKSDDDKNGD
jgi:hypothetical protein